MAKETPVRVAVIGAGPLGIEAALYARYLGYDAIVFERAQVGERLSQVCAENLPTPAGKNRTSLGIAALEAQDAAFQTPEASAAESASAFWEKYLVPLAGSDLLVTCIRAGHTVKRIERTELSEIEDQPEDQMVDQRLSMGAGKESDAGTESASQADEEEDDEYEIRYAPFLLTVKLADGSELTSLAEIVIDASGLAESGDAQSEQSLEPKYELISSGLTNPLLAAKHPSSALMTEEPNFYRLGLAARGEATPLTLPEGHDQIRQIFSVIGEREALNLYETFQQK